MNGPAGVRRPICHFCRLLPHNNPTTQTGRWTVQPLGPLQFARSAPTHVHIPKKYGDNVGRTIEKVLEDHYFVKFMRSQEEPSVVTAEEPGSSKATLDFRSGRFYDLEPVEAINDILMHHFPEDYFWPNPRIPPEVEADRTWRDIDWDGWDNHGQNNSMERRRVKLKIVHLREAIENGMGVKSVYFSQIDLVKINSSKFLVLLEAFRIYMRQEAWENFHELLELVNLDSSIHKNLRRGIYNQLFKEIVAHGRKRNPPKEVVETLIVSFNRPFTSEMLLYLVDHIKITTTVLKIFKEDHGILPHISVSNKAFAKEMSILENSRRWPKKGDKPRTDPTYYIERRKLVRKFTTHFDADRVNTESIRLLFKYAVDRDEVKRIWNIAIQAAKQDPVIIRKTQHLYLEALLRFPIKLDMESDEGGWESSEGGVARYVEAMALPPIIYQNAANLADACAVMHTLREHKQPLNRETLLTLIKLSAKYGSSRTLNLLVPKLTHARWKPTPRELREILKLLPEESSTDYITQRLRIIEYIRALGRCGATHEVCEEWSKLRDRGFQMADGGGMVKDGTLAAFITTLGMAGDIISVKRCFADIKSVKTTSMPQGPMFFAGLLSCRPSHSNPTFGQEYAYPLYEAVEGMAGVKKVMDKVLRRMRTGRLTTKWTRAEWFKANAIFYSATKIVRFVKRGDDLEWAENAVVELLGKAESDGSVPGGRVSVAVPWPAKLPDAPPLPLPPPVDM